MKRLGILIVILAFAVAASAQQPPVVAAPEISVSANGSSNVTLYQGSPLIVSVNILNSTRLAGANWAPLVISPEGTAWTDVIQFTAVSSAGSSFRWPLKLAGSPATPALTLQRNSYVRAIWQMPATDTTTLPVDSYQLTATIQVANSTGWNGVATSTPVTVQVAPPTSSPTPDQQLGQALLAARYHANAGDLNSGLTTMQQYLKTNPGNPAALSAVANLLELLGYPALAFPYGRDALNAYYQANPTPPEAPSNLLSMYQRLFAHMTTPNLSAASTSTIAASVSVGHSASSQTVTLSATVTSASASVNEGTVVFKVVGVGHPVSVTAVDGNATANFTVPGATPVGSYPLEVSYSGTSSFSPSSASAELTITGVSVPGDLNGDGSVGCDDLAIVKASFGKKKGQPGFDPRADVNGDGVVNILDLSFVARLLPAGVTCH